MAKQYSLEQFPKNKNIDVSKLNENQIKIRNNKKSKIQGEEKVCNRCLKKQPITEFYFKNKTTGRRGTICRDCILKQMGVIEVGKLRFADKIEEKGFRKCSICKTIKPINEFKKNKGQKNGISNTCYECGHKLHRDFILKQRNDIGDFYVRQYCLRNYNYIPKTKEDIEKYRNEIIEKRAPKFFIDGKAFVTIAETARYIEMEYGIPVSATEKRISEGKTLEECKLTESEMRSKAHTKGQIKVTDTVTGKIFLFKNATDENLLKMFATSTISSAIKSGKPTRITKLSKHKNPCIIQRVQVK